MVGSRRREPPGAAGSRPSISNVWYNLVVSWYLGQEVRDDEENGATNQPQALALWHDQGLSRGPAIAAFS